MHVCLISRMIKDHGVAGGMDIHGDVICQALILRGHRVSVITGAHPQGLTHHEAEGLDVHYLAGVPANKYSRQWWHRSAQACAALLQRDPVDLVWSQSAGALGWLKLDHGKSGCPSVATMHGVPFAWIKATWNNLYSWRGAMHLGLATSKAVYQYFSWERYFRRFTSIIAVNPLIIPEIAGSYGVDQAKIQCIPNGVDVDYFQPDMASVKMQAIRKQEGITEKNLVVLLASRLVREKGAHYAILAWRNVVAAFPQAKLLIVGEGPFRNTLEKMTRHLGLSGQVIFIGQIPNHAIVDYYRLADVFLMPTTWLEGSPFALLEAMACGATVVASAIGGIPAIVKDNDDGLLFQPRNVKQMTEALTRLLGDPDLRQTLAIKARAKMELFFSLDRMIDLTITAFESLAQKK